MCSPDGSPNYAMVLRWSNRRARDHRNHVAPRKKPIPASQRSQLTKTLLWTCKLFQNQTVFSQTFMCRSQCRCSRICRLKKFQNATVHAYRSYRKESAYAVSEEIDLQKRSNPPHHENKNEEQMETWRAHQSAWVPSRQAGDPETRSSYPSLWGVTEEKNAHAYFTETVPLFPGVVEGTSFFFFSVHCAAVFSSSKFEQYTSIDAYTTNIDMANWETEREREGEIENRERKARGQRRYKGREQGTSFAWGLKNKHNAAICHAEKTPEKGIPTLIRHPPAKRTHRYWTTARDRQRAETTRTFFFVEKTRCHEYTYKRRPGVACAFRLAPMARCRGSCRCMSLNGWSWPSFDGLFFFQILSLRVTPFVHLSTEVRCCVSHRTVCSWLGVVWAMMFNRGILFYSKWPFGQSQHIKEKQSFSFVNSSSLDWVNMKRESSSKVHQRGVVRGPRSKKTLLSKVS